MENYEIINSIYIHLRPSPYPFGIAAFKLLSKLGIALSDSEKSNGFESYHRKKYNGKTIKNIKDIQELNKYPINILFVEDNFADELLIRSATNGIDHKIFILRDADQLINYLNNHLPNVPFYIPDLIILDLRMKNISGVELLALIKRNQKTKHVPVIIYSNHCEVNVLKLCYQNGACGFINKSFNKADCIRSLQKTIDYWSNCVVLPRDNRT